jgi:hypothetical protein
MPAIKYAPTPEQFAKVWTAHFAAAVREGAGKDGRLSMKEAQRINERIDALKLWGDNAVNFLEHTGQKSVRLNKLIASGYNYAIANADKVDGKSGTVSLVEARKMALDLQDDFSYLRGRLTIK